MREMLEHGILTGGIRGRETGGPMASIDEKALTIGLPSGIRAAILPFGATLQSLRVPDRNGQLGDVVLGLSDPAALRGERSFRGTTVGRYANRIAGARFTLDGTEHRLDANEGANTLHGGAEGFDRCEWEVAAHWMSAVTLRLASDDGDQGFPGALEVEAEFALTAPATLTITYRARVSRACPVSITSHGFFNLSGGGHIGDHMLQIAAQHFLPVDDQLIPTGALRGVAGTPFDFRKPRPMGGEDFDHCFCLDPAEGMREVASLFDPASGREMRLESNQPGLQLYTVNTPNAELAPHHAVCLEPQAWPDAPNHPEFPDAILRPGETYENQIRFVFSTRDS